MITKKEVRRKAITIQMIIPGLTFNFIMDIFSKFISFILNIRTVVLIGLFSGVITFNCFSQSQPVDISGMVESLYYDSISKEASAMLYVSYDNNYDLPTSIIIGMYISRDTVKDSKDIKFTEFNLSPSSFVDSYKRWGPATVGMSGAEAGDWYILMVIDETNSRIKRDSVYITMDQLIITGLKTRKMELSQASFSPYSLLASI